MAKTTNTNNTTPSTDKATFVFGKENYRLMLIGLAVIFIGFVLMYGSDDIMSSTKITVAPIVVMIGFTIEFFAILRKQKD